MLMHPSSRLGRFCSFRNDAPASVNVVNDDIAATRRTVPQYKRNTQIPATSSSVRLRVYSTLRKKRYDPWCSEAEFGAFIEHDMTSHCVDYTLENVCYANNGSRIGAHVLHPNWAYTQIVDLIA